MQKNANGGFWTLGPIGLNFFLNMVVLYIIGKLFTKEPSAKNEAERIYRSFKTKEEGINGSTTIAPKKNCLPDNCPLDNCPQEKFPPDNCPLTINFPSKIIAPTQANTSQRVLWVNWGKLCIVSSTIIYKYCKLRVKSDLLPYIFTDFN